MSFFSLFFKFLLKVQQQLEKVETDLEIGALWINHASWDLWLQRLPRTSYCVHDLRCYYFICLSKQCSVPVVVEVRGL